MKPVLNDREAYRIAADLRSYLFGCAGLPFIFLVHEEDACFPYYYGGIPSVYTLLQGLAYGLSYEEARIWGHLPDSECDPEEVARAIHKQVAMLRRSALPFVLCWSLPGESIHLESNMESPEKHLVHFIQEEVAMSLPW